MTGYQSKKAAAQDKLVVTDIDGHVVRDARKSKKVAAQDKLNDDDDTQVYGDALTIAYQSGYYDGKKAAQRTWVGLTPEDTFEIGERLGLSDIAWVDLMQAIEAKLKEKNT